jgi:hypothetical protein
MIMSALRASIDFGSVCYPDLTVGLLNLGASRLRWKTVETVSG